MTVKRNKLYYLVLGLMVAVVIVALGGGLFGQQSAWFLQWQHKVFASLCHQLPERSFWIGGQPMAVCSRCFGIYSGFLMGWMLLPLGIFSIKQDAVHKNMVVAAVILNALDIAGNMLGFWHNTLLSRLALGWLIGLSAAVLFSGAFFIKINKQKEEHYGRVTTSGI